jgi:hypothetical protein
MHHRNVSAIAMSAPNVQKLIAMQIKLFEGSLPIL